MKKDTKNVVKPEAIKAAKDLHTAGKSTAFIRSSLIVNGHADSDASANAIMKEAGIARTSSNFRDRLYDDLRAGKTFTKEAFHTLIMKESKNVQVHESHYYGIVELVAAVKAAKK